MIKQVTEVKSIKDFRIELTGKEIIQALNGQIKLDQIIPDSASVSTTTPGGGDWSNSKLDIDVDQPVVISWQVTTIILPSGS